MEELRPEYGEGSLADVPGTVMELLSVENDLSSLSEDIIDTDRSFETVVVILVDGLRCDRVEKTDTGFFGEAKEKGSLEKITSVFPSATPATLTTLNTGRRPLGHGLLGWEMYYREFEDHIFTLPFRTREGDSPEDVYGFRPENLFEGSSIYEKLSNSGIDCFSVVDRELEDSEYTELTSSGAEKVPYYDTADMALKVGEVLSEKDGGKYIYGYTPDVDSVSHLEGPGTEAVKNQMEKISKTLERNLVEGLEPEEMKDSLVIVTSDHGQIEAGERIDLLQWDKVPECIEKDENGDLIEPSGNAGRSVFLHVEDDKVDELKGFLDQKLDAQVLKTQEAIDEGLFGRGLEAEKFRDRAGDLTIISRGRKIHWFRPEELEDIGVHGGLHRKEMEVPLLYCRLSDLQ